MLVEKKKKKKRERERERWGDEFPKQADIVEETIYNFTHTHKKEKIEKHQTKYPEIKTQTHDENWPQLTSGCVAFEFAMSRTWNS
jgi:hypothetical protein